MKLEFIGYQYYHAAFVKLSDDILSAVTIVHGMFCASIASRYKNHFVISLFQSIEPDFGCTMCIRPT